MEVSQDITLAEHKANCFRGLIRARLDCLQFNHQLFLNKHREESPQNVRRLQKIFEKTGCLRLQDENIIDAVVEDDRLNAALHAIGLSNEALQKICSPEDAPSLYLGELRCLNGLHRIRAADQYLNENDKWWVVRLFSSETPTPVLSHIIESYTNEQKPSDGEIFRRIRLYHRENKVEAERKWWARLHNSKPKDLRQLFKRRELISGFDKLLEMPGLWSKVQLGALHRLLTLKCDEEMSHYLSRILQVWTKILTCRNTTLPFSAVDAVTVESLELLAPKHSTIDKAFVLSLFERNIVFPSQLDSQIRRELAENICASEGLIPSLWTFFETLKYIEPICETLKKLIGNNMKRTIRSSLMGCYFPPDKRNIQVAKFREAEITSIINQEEAAWISYVELWAFCGRYFNKLTSFTPRKESGEAKPTVEGPNPVLWQHLASFSVSRGFKTKRAQELANTDPHTELAYEYLRKSSPLSASSYERQIHEIHSDILHPIFVHSSTFDTDPMDLVLEDQHTSNAIQGLKTQIEALHRDYNSLLSQHENLQTRNEELESEKLNFRQRCQSLQDQADQDGNSISSLGSNIQDLQRRNKELEAEKLDYQQRCQSLEDQRNGDRDAISSLQLKQQEIERLRLENDMLKTNLETLKTSAQQADQTIKNSQALVLKLQKDKEKLEAKQATSQNDLRMLRNDRFRLFEENQDRMKDIQAMNNERDALILQHSQEFAQTIPTGPEYEDPKGTFVNELEEREFHTPWRPYSGNKYEIFLAESNDDTGLPKGTSIEVDKDELDAISIITAILGGAKEYFGQELRAMNIQGKYLANISPTSIFAACTMYRTILVSKTAVLENYISTGACQNVIATLSDGSLRLVQGAQRQMIEEAEGTKKRRLENDSGGTDIVLASRRIHSRGGVKGSVVPNVDDELDNTEDT
ncbi:hypothetical protein BM1_10003 [Bipolaris maydis]|nr:hypothetical protein BM1_10003 [Bipolaris maydis]